MTETMTLELIPQLLNDKQKAAFFDVFWKTWATNGFGTLTKKDSELLIFSCLKKAFGAKGPSSNYQWATLLRLTPTKIKSMRLEAYLRFGHLFDETGVGDANAFLQRFGEVQSVDLHGLESGGSVENVTVSFVVEDPVVQMVIENSLKSLGSYLDFHRNKEVVRLRLVDFLRIVADGEQKKAIDKWVAEKAKEKSEAGSLTSRVKAKEYSEKTELQKLGAFLDDLSEYKGTKVLTDHLKTIFKSQGERKKKR